MSLFKANKVLYRCILALMIGYVVMTVISWGSLPAYMRKPELASYLKHIGLFVFGIYMISRASLFSNYAGLALFNSLSWQTFVLVSNEISLGGIEPLDFFTDVDGVRLVLLVLGTLLLWIPVAKKLKKGERLDEPESHA